jgi:Raf kinase inhibitor-like YbhB/YbcL family protein
MLISSQSFAHGSPIPAEFAFGRLDEHAPMALSDNRNPHLAWEEVPAGTRSFALICVDSEVPTIFDDVNQAGKSIPADQPRQDFIHWVMIDLPADLREIRAGSCADGVVKGGRRDPTGPAGSRQGLNDYGGFMGDGDYYGYDGPCPPWNDERVHQYHFRLYALDVEHLPIEHASFSAAEVLAAMQGHVLASADLSGSYTLNRQMV